MVGPEYKKTLNFLVYTFKYSIKQSNQIISRYGASIGKPKPINATKRYYNNIGVDIQLNWSKFVQFTRTIKDDYKRDFNKKHPKRKLNNDSYGDWYDQCNMDGSFAYNGIADDF